LGNKLAKIR